MLVIRAEAVRGKSKSLMRTAYVISLNDERSNGLRSMSRPLLIVFAERRRVIQGAMDHYGVD